MKTFKFLFLVTIFVLVNSKIDEIDESADLAIAAIKEVLKDHFALKEPKVDFYFCGLNSATMVRKILHENPSAVSARVIRLDTVKSKNIRIDSPSIILCDSPEHLLRIFQKFTWNVRNGVWPNVLVYVPIVPMRLDIVLHLIKEDYPIEAWSFLREIDDKTINLVTSYKFSKGPKCNSPVDIDVNQFSTTTMKWQNGNFFPEKYENFYGCTLRVGYAQMSPGNFEIFELLAGTLNFRFNQTEIDIPRNLNFTNLTKQLDVVYSMDFQNKNIFENFEFTSPLYTDYLTFTVPVGEPYTQLEKMFLMFDKPTWLCIGVTLAAAFLVVQSINFMSVVIQKFVFGRDVQTPTLNIASIFLNGGQFKVPGRNFARFMLMMFVVWSLIIRTCYQSELYKNLQNDMRKPRFQTIDELNAQNFTFYYITEQYKSLKEIALNRFKLSKNVTELPDVNAFVDYENKMTVAALRKIRNFDYSGIKYEDTILPLLGENTASFQLSIVFLRYHPLTKTFIKHVDRFLSSNLLKEVEKMRAWSENPQQKKENAKPVILTMDHLGICFIAVLVCQALSCVVFILECIVKKFEIYMARRQ